MRRVTREDGPGELAGSGHDDAQPCVDGGEHAWAVKGIHLSLVRGAEFEEHCSQEGCETVRYRTDRLRGKRPLGARRLRGG